MPITPSAPKIGGIHHVTINARDFERSLKFYKEVLGFPIRIAWGQKPGRAAMLDTGNSSYVELFERPGAAPVREEGVLVHFALRAENCDAALERARAAGCVVTVEPKDVNIPSTPGPTPVRIAFVKGPDGEVIEFFQNEST